MSAYGFYGQAATSAMTATAPADGFGGAMGGANGPRRDHVTRILVVGETRVGKTLLIRRLCDHIFGDTAIETSVVDYSPFNSNAATERAADDDDLGPEWGPTVGLAVDALKRSTTVLSAVPPSNDLRMPPLYAPASSPSATASAAGGLSSSVPADNSSYGGYPSLYGAPTLLNGGGGGGGGLQYRGANPAGNANAFNGPLGGSHPTHPAPLQHRCTVTQTVEFHELGGTHGYRDIARLPLRSLHYDGVIFVYHRRNPTSTLYLADWYHWVRNVLSTSASVSGPGNPHNGTGGVAGSRTMPRFMLVGTQLEGDEVTAAAAGMRKVVDGTLHIGAMAVSDEALLDGNIELKVRALQSPQTPTRRSRTRAVCRSVLHSLTVPYHLLWCAWHPFFFLSEQYQEERGPRSKVVTLGVRLVERLLWLLYRCEQGLLYVMAVVLFGPYQEAVVLGHASAKQTLEELRKDEQCVAQAHVCRLDSDIALQSSLDEMVAFFDILLRQE